MRVGMDFLSDSASRSSGTLTYLQGFLGALASIGDRGHDYYFFIHEENERTFSTFSNPNFHIVVLPRLCSRREVRVLAQQVYLPHYVRKMELDVIDFLGTTGCLRLSCAVAQHVKTLHHILVPDSLDTPVRLFRSVMMNLSAHTADLIIANSEDNKRNICRFLKIPEERVSIVPEAVDRDVFSPHQNGGSFSSPDLYKTIKPFILFVSTLWPYKNAEGLIRAYAHLVIKYKIPHYLVIVGGDYRGEQIRLKGVVGTLNISDRVIFTGHITDRSIVRDFYAAADVFVYPSYCETFGLPILEAMACGTPVVGSNCTSVPEVIGDAGIIVDPDDSPSLASAIYSLISDQAMRDVYIRKGSQRAAEFTWENTVRRTLAALEKAFTLHENS